ncbi:hypothetical protein [Ottowia thiooxydans]|uniref:hypothetical protein n=1 Tax=Ottowia thiooxydans TaxID=219182 RepID=UPI0004015F76|nr:hypothetical protein [Ottowia thiooxydans]
MKTKNIALATLLATAFAGNAFAFPVSGEGPLFQTEAVAASTTSREVVRQDAVAHFPAAGVQNAVAANRAAPSQVTRAQVRQETREAVAHGNFAKSGEMS